MYRKITQNGKWQIVLIIAYTVITLLFIGSARADQNKYLKPFSKNVTKKIISTGWLEDVTLKYGLMTTFCIAQGTTGLIESAKYGGLYLSNSADDYHVYRFVQNLSWISTGWFLYANIKQKNKSWWAKASRIVGIACYARNANELVYRWNVTGSPFNYSDKYSSNKKAIVFIKWDGNHGKFIDFYIPGTGEQGAIIDASFFVVGFLLNKIGDIR